MFVGRQSTLAMKIEPPPPTESSAEGYEPLGWYEPEEALKLLKRFDDEGVFAQIDQSAGGDDASAVWGSLGHGFGTASQILISVKDSCREKAQQIHRELFGEYREAGPPEQSVVSDS
jgi:hypothetical protein